MSEQFKIGQIVRLSRTTGDWHMFPHKDGEKAIIASYKAGTLFRVEESSSNLRPYVFVPLSNDKVEGRLGAGRNYFEPLH